MEKLEQLVLWRKVLTKLRRETEFLQHLCLSADVSIKDNEATSDDERNVHSSVCELDGDHEGMPNTEGAV